MTSNADAAGRAGYQRVGLALGPVVAIVMIVAGPPDSLSIAAWYTAAISLLMAIWWATEAIPIAVTALLPLVLFPWFGIADMQTAASPFANKVVFLFLGGFIVALAMQRWNLHRRIALTILQYSGGNGRALVGGFMLATAFVSMWVTNTSTTMMMLPIAVSVVAVIHSTVRDLSDSAKRDFQYALILSVAYASTIGGLATLVGTAPNAIAAAFILENYGTQIDFVSWMLVGVPLTALILPLTWLVLTRVAFKVDFHTSVESRAHLRKLKSDLGAISTAERRVGVVFLLLALTWIFRPLLGRLPGLESLDDSGIAMAGAVALFLIPSGDAKDPQLLRWEQVENLPWGILLLFGGGLSMANSVAETGLAAWIGDSLHLVATLPDAVVIMIISTIIILLGELTSNVATTVTFLPVAAAIAMAAGIDPVVLLVPITLAASCSFMLPAGTPPNAIVFGSGLLTIPKMVRAGFAVDIICIVLVPVIALTLVPIFMRG